MSDFLKFLESQGASGAAKINLPAVAEDLSLSVPSLLNSNLGSDKAAEFTREITELATSKDVLSEWSDSIGAPHKGESEDEFVLRAKAKLKGILKQRLSKS